MRTEPLFIRFANKEIDASGVIKSIIENAQDENTKKIAEEALNSVPDLMIFRNDFKKALEDLIDTGLNNQFINYVNCYMKPSLIEYIDSNGVLSKAGERRWVSVKEADAPWIEAIVCYNLSLYIRTYGIDQIKKCSVCKKFFSQKGKYAKYCGEGCKKRGER